MLLLICSLGFILGAAIGLALPEPLPHSHLAVASVALALMAAVLVWPNRTARLLAIALLAAAFGAMRAHIDVRQLTAQTLPLDTLAVQGVVAETPRELGRLRTFVVDVDRVFDGSTWSVARSRVEVRAFGWSPGDGERVEAIGSIRTVTDVPGLPRASLLRQRRVTQELAATQVRLLGLERHTDQKPDVELFRQWLEDRIASRLPEPNAALVSGLLLGSRSALPADFRAHLAQTGTSHIVAVSGFNVVIVAGFVMAVTAWLFGPRAAAAPAILATIAYTVLVGAPASAVRATIMADVALAASLFRRPSDSVAALVLSGALMAAFDPLVIQDLGFQLSMLATAGLVLMRPREEPTRRSARWAVRLLGPPLAAQVFTLPLILHTFQTLSVVALLSNVLVAPMIPAAMAAGALLLLLQPIGVLAWIPAAAAFAASEWIVNVIRFTAQLPGSWVATGAFPTWLMVGCYGALGLVVVSRSADVELFGVSRPRAAPWLTRSAAALTVTLTALAIVAFRPPGELQAEVFEHGDVVFARGPNGRTAVIGAGMSPTVLTATVAERLAPWEQAVDLVVVLDDSASQLTAVNALSQRYTVRVLVVPDAADRSLITGRVERFLILAHGAEVHLGDGLVARAIRGRDSDAEAETVALELRYGSTALSFPWGSDQSLVHSEGPRVWVVRDWRHAPSIPEASVVVAWGTAARSQRDVVTRALTILPSRDGTVSIRSDGAELRAHWPHCVNEVAGCATVLAGAGHWGGLSGSR